MKKEIKKEIKKVVKEVKEEVKKEVEKIEGFDPSIPERKQRHIYG